MGFHVDLKLEKFKSIFPEMPPSEEIVNYGLDDYDSIWRKIKPTIITSDFMALEAKRLRQGCWIKIKDTVLWIPPNYYQNLQYGIYGGEDAQFRLKRLKHHYEKILVRNNPEAIGTYTIKNRQDGETTEAMGGILWDASDGVSFHGQFGIQSKTDKDAQNPCWAALKSHWMNYPKWMKDMFYSDFASGNNIETQMRWTREEKQIRNLRGEMETQKSRNVWAAFYPSVYNAMDGKANMLRCVLDEVNKWKNCSLFDTYINYKKFILVGSERRGLFDMFSSPADINGRWNDEALAFWDSCDPTKLNDKGTTASRVFALYSDPLEGIQGKYDRWGDAEPNEIRDWIMAERKALPEDKRLGEIRGFPLNREEMFGSFEHNTIWDNHKGIVKRQLYVMNSIYKDEVTKEQKYIWGNLEWDKGVIDSRVVFRPNPDGNFFCKNKGRFCFSELPQWETELNNIFKPPSYVTTCLGVDPFHLGKNTKNPHRQSMAGAVTFKFRDFGNEEYTPRPTSMYNCRTDHIHTFFEDMIKLCVYTRSMMQYERTSDEIERYFDDRDYGAWILNSKGKKGKKTTTKGDVQRGKGGGGFITEVLALVNVLTNLPLSEGQPYLLENFWFEMLLEQIISFDRNDTSASDLFMGFGQSVMGAAKISSVKIRNGNAAAVNMLNHFLS